MADWLNTLEYPESESSAEPHLFQVCSMYDDMDFSLHFFDDHFAARHPERVTFPLWEQQTLPDQVLSEPGRFVWRGTLNEIEPRANGVGDVYLIFIVVESRAWLEELYGAFRLRGLRLPELAGYLQSVRPQAFEQRSLGTTRELADWPTALCLLRWAAMQSALDVDLESILARLDGWDPHQILDHLDRVALAGDWQTCEQGWHEAVANLEGADLHGWKYTREPTFIQSAPHFAQLGFTDQHSSSWNTETYNTQWYLFDDLWAASHPDMATSLLHWAGKQLPLRG